MDFLLYKGKDFKETFDFKNGEGRSIVLPTGEYKLLLERGSWAKEYTSAAGLKRSRTQLVWTIPKQQTKDFAYNTLYYTLYMNGTELARGVVKVQ